ncbi:MAG: hypothetical protein R3Y43_00085 [Alphaproteobacteria bacterium]
MARLQEERPIRSWNNKNIPAGTASDGKIVKTSNQQLEFSYAYGKTIEELKKAIEKKEALGWQKTGKREEHIKGFTVTMYGQKLFKGTLPEVPKGAISLEAGKIFIPNEKKEQKKHLQIKSRR